MGYWPWYLTPVLLMNAVLLQLYVVLYYKYKNSCSNYVFSNTTYNFFWIHRYMHIFSCWKFSTHADTMFTLSSSMVLGIHQWNLRCISIMTDTVLSHDGSIVEQELNSWTIINHIASKSKSQSTYNIEYWW